MKNYHMIINCRLKKMKRSTVIVDRKIVKNTLIEIVFNLIIYSINCINNKLYLILIKSILLSHLYFINIYKSENILQIIPVEFEGKSEERNFSSWEKMIISFFFVFFLKDYLKYICQDQAKLKPVFTQQQKHRLNYDAIYSEHHLP